jgi:hypothetical protein
VPSPHLVMVHAPAHLQLPVPAHPHPIPILPHEWCQEWMGQ